MAAVHTARKKAARKRRWVVAALLLALVAIGIGGWRVQRHSQQLAQELAKRLAREQQLEQRIAEAQAEEDRRLKAIEAARLAQQQALREAEQDRSDAETALSEKELAEQERAQATAAAERARRLAAEAERRAAAERKKREAEWARFAAALERVMPSERSGWNLTATVPQEFDRERRSRLAGVLLANQGYRAIIEDGGDPARAQSLKQYLVDAGVPPEVLHRAAGKRLRLLIADTILNTPAPAPAEPPLPSAPKAAAPKPAAAGPGYQIQVASLRDPADAERLAGELRAKKYQVELDSATRQGWTRVLVGPFNSRTEAERVEGRLRSGGYDTWLQQR